MGVISRAAVKYVLVAVLALGCEASPGGDDGGARAAGDSADAGQWSQARGARDRLLEVHQAEAAPFVWAMDGPTPGALGRWSWQARGAAPGAPEEEAAPEGDLPEGRAPDCVVDEDCSPVEVCNFAFSPRGGVCMNRGIAGGRCAEDADCHSTLACRVAAGAPYAVCTRPAATGAPCFTMYGCGDGLSCVRSGYQTRCTDGAEGSPCETQPHCDPGL